MGEVYRAEQLDVEGQALRDVALKMIRPDHASDPNFASRFLREVRVATRLRSPHTVTVYDVGQGEDGQEQGELFRDTVEKMHTSVDRIAELAD